MTKSAAKKRSARLARPSLSRPDTSVPSSGSHLTVVASDDFGQHPHCEQHGPALLFRETFDDPAKTPSEFFGCSANRDRHACRVRTSVDAEQLAAEEQCRVGDYEQRMEANEQLLSQVEALAPTDRSYCLPCGRLVLPADLSSHTAHSALIQRSISDHALRSPTRLLVPLSNDRREAQYFFADSTLRAIERVLVAADVGRVVCIGAPRLHEYVRENAARLRCRSVLLDLDDRLEQFYGRAEFFRFNMFNGWWVDGAGRGQAFDAFLRGNSAEESARSLLLFTDPPFGCRTEPLAHTLSALQQRFAALNGRPRPAAALPIMWVFPYFQAQYIQASMPQLEASAYAVNYTGHKAYRTADDGGRKFGSPVRWFTNIPQAIGGREALPADEGYRVCEPCGGRWRAPGTAAHCAKCGVCAGANGAEWRHCAACEQCVKPSYRHCTPCGRCVQAVGVAPHDCGAYRRCVRCWICRRRGHVERECVEWQRSGAGRRVWREWSEWTRKAEMSKLAAEPRRMCLICGRLGHNELRCGKRATRLKEWRFGGDVFNVFNSQ